MALGASTLLPMTNIAAQERAAGVTDSGAREQLAQEIADEAAAFQGLSRLVNKVSLLALPSVVHIEANKTETKQGRRETFEEAGAGVIVSLKGRTWVITNRHVIHSAAPNEIDIQLHDGQLLHPVRLAEDESTDVAMMEIQGNDFVPAKLGDGQAVSIGDFVVAIGSPFGLAHSVTFGIVSAKGRRDLTLGDQAIELQDFFQTDAAINPGNSGGPLLNLRGEVIGLNTAIASSSGGSEGIGFAIPIHIVMLVADQLAEEGQLRRGYLGVKLKPFTAADSKQLGFPDPHGAMVSRVEPRSPASAIGLRVGDLIVEYDGIKIEDDDHLVTIVGLAGVGRQVPIKYYREGTLIDGDVTVTVKPTAPAANVTVPASGGVQSNRFGPR
jgi:serine protease Do